MLDENTKAAPGCLAKVTKNTIWVQTGEGVLSLLEVQLEGKKRMTTESFLNGYTVEEGTYFKKG